MTTQDKNYDLISEIIGKEIKDGLGKAIEKIIKIGNGENISLSDLDSANAQELCKAYIEQLASVNLTVDINPVERIRKREKAFKPLILLPSGRSNNEILAPSLGVSVKLTY